MAAYGTSGSFSTTQPKDLTPGWVYWVSSTSTTKRTITATFRENGTTFAKAISIGDGPQPYVGSQFATLAVDTGDSSVTWTSLPLGLPFPTAPSLARNADGSFVDGGARAALAQGLGQSQPSLTVVPDSLKNATLTENLKNDSSVAGAGADGVLVSGAATYAVGTHVYFALAIAGNLVTAGDPLTYLDIREHTSGKPVRRVYCSNSGTGILTGDFYAAVADTYDIGARNADTVAHQMTANVEAWNGV